MQGEAVQKEVWREYIFEGWAVRVSVDQAYCPGVMSAVSILLVEQERTFIDADMALLKLRPSNIMMEVEQMSLVAKLIPGAPDGEMRALLTFVRTNEPNRKDHDDADRPWLDRIRNVVIDMKLL